MSTRPAIASLLVVTVAACSADALPGKGSEAQTEIAATAEPLALTGQPIEHSIPLDPEARGRIDRALTREDPRALVVRFEGIDWERSPGLHYEVYVNLPAGAKPDPEGPHFVGNLSFFGPQSGQKDQVEELSLVAPLRELARRDPGTERTPLTLTLAPRGPVLVEGEPAPQLAVPKVSIRRVAVVTADPKN
ncbi:MAG TPA: hypothetical protein VNJ70_01150 [Thermoanaerobaculia bacterium]|nr:hypothetical protein [Thermoanaerobaculia bacterium]